MKKSDKNPLVSVVIPVWNSEKYIDEAINSIVHQTYQNLEIIIINDASTDETPRIVDSWALKDKRIRVIHNKRNLGIGGNRSKGVAEARGNFICWQDADDIAFPYRVERQVEILLKDESIGVVGGGLQFFDSKGDGVVRTYAEDDESLRRTIFRYNPIAQPASVFRRSVFDVVGGYDASLAVSEDLDMWFRLGEQYKFANTSDVVIRYRQSDGSLTASRLRDMEKVTLMLRRKFKKSPAYKWTFVDSIYNFLQSATMFVPAGIRMKAFAFIRGDK